MGAIAKQLLGHAASLDILKLTWMKGPSKENTFGVAALGSQFGPSAGLCSFLFHARIRAQTRQWTGPFSTFGVSQTNPHPDAQCMRCKATLILNATHHHWADDFILRFIPSRPGSQNTFYCEEHYKEHLSEWSAQSFSAADVGPRDSHPTPK